MSLDLLLAVMEEKDEKEDSESLLTAGTGRGYPSLPNLTLGFGLWSVWLEEMLELELTVITLGVLEGLLGGILGTAVEGSRSLLEGDLPDHWFRAILSLLLAGESIDCWV